MTWSSNPVRPPHPRRHPPQSPGYQQGWERRKRPPRLLWGPSHPRLPRSLLSFPSSYTTKTCAPRRTWHDDPHVTEVNWFLFDANSLVISWGAFGRLQIASQVAKNPASINFHLSATWIENRCSRTHLCTGCFFSCLLCYSLPDIMVYA